MSFDKVDIVVVVTATIVMVALQAFVRRTKTGRSMRAVAEDREIASLMGIDVDRVVVITFVIGGMLAGVAGVLYSLTFGQVSATMGFLPGIAAFTAAVLGGIGSIPGAALGGLLLGVAESVGPYLLLSGVHAPSPFELKGVITFSVLVLVLIFRPGGHPGDRRGGQGMNRSVFLRGAVRSGAIGGRRHRVPVPRRHDREVRDPRGGRAASSRSTGC